MGTVALADRWLKARLAGEVRPLLASLSSRSAFTGFRFPTEVITVAVRWYLRSGLSYRDVEELLAERTHLRSVSAVPMPSYWATAPIAAHSES